MKMGINDESVGNCLQLIQWEKETLQEHINFLQNMEREPSWMQTLFSDDLFGLLGQMPIGEKDRFIEVAFDEETGQPVAEVEFDPKSTLPPPSEEYLALKRDQGELTEKDNEFDEDKDKDQVMNIEDSEGFVDLEKLREMVPPWMQGKTTQTKTKSKNKKGYKSKASPGFENFDIKNRP